MNEHILCISRDDVSDASIVVNVTTHGLSPLDLTLLATESEFPYVAKLEQSRVSKLRNRAGPIDKQQWQEVLTRTLIHDERDEPASDEIAHDDIQLAASITGNRLSIIFRRNIEGIVQRLGEVVLNKDVEQEIELFDWIQVAVKRSDSLGVKVHKLQLRSDEQYRQMQKLAHQIEDFVQAKQDHETDLLEKFQRLLNEKKLKIRDQQRLLNTAQTCRSTSPEVKKASSKASRKAPAESRAGKRKAKTPAVESESDSDDGFERMRQPNDQTQSEQETPEEVDWSATASEDSDNDASALQRSMRTGDIQRDELVAPSSDASTVNKEHQDPPPVRDLPFIRQSSSVQQTPSPEKTNQSMADSDETTDDDEL